MHEYIVQTIISLDESPTTLLVPRDAKSLETLQLSLVILPLLRPRGFGVLLIGIQGAARRHVGACVHNLRLWDAELVHLVRHGAETELIGARSESCFVQFWFLGTLCGKSKRSASDCYKLRWPLMASSGGTDPTTDSKASGLAKAKARAAAKVSAEVAARSGPWPERTELMDAEELLAALREPGAQLLVLRASLRTGSVFAGAFSRQLSCRATRAPLPATLSAAHAQ